MKTVVTGGGGFIGGYLVAELLGRGHEVVVLDDLTKYGEVTRSYDGHPRYRFVEGDARDVDLLRTLLDGARYLVAGAALVGGIGYVNSRPYDILATNERIVAAACDAALAEHPRGTLEKITYVSSSMVFESATKWPSYEGQELEIPPPASAYGLQKLAGEYAVRAAWEQYGLPFTIVRPFNCVGVGEGGARFLEQLAPGNDRLARSHVVPDLVDRVLRREIPLRILGDGEQVRHFTYAGDSARGIATALESEAALNEDFNISTSVSTTVRQLATTIWKKVHGDADELVFEYLPGFEHDVARRVPDVRKARDLLGFRATTPLEAVLDEVIPWIAASLEAVS